MKLQYLAISIFTILALTGVGWLISYALKLSKGIRSSSDLLLAYTIGLYSITICYSLIKTSFISINLIALLVLLTAYYCFSKRYTPKSPTGDFESQPHFNIGIIFSLVGVFIIFHALNLRFWETDFRLTHLNGDHHLTANISYYANLTGEENEFHVLNTVSTAYHGLTPYHYSELWLNSIIAEPLGLNYDLTLLMVVPALFYFPVFVALLVLCETIGLKSKITALLFSSCFLFYFGSLVPIDFLKATEISFLENLRNNYVFSGLKQAPYLLFTFLFIILWLREQRLLAYFSLIFMSVVQFTSIPAVFGFLFIWFIFWGFYKKRKEERVALFCLVGIALVYILQKSVFGNSEVAREGTTVGALLQEALNFTSYFKNRLSVFLKSLIFLFLDYHLLWLMTLLITAKADLISSNSKPFLILLGISFFGLGLYSLLFQIVNSDQLFYLLSNTSIHAFFFFVTIWSLAHNAPLNKLLLGGVMVFIAFGIYAQLFNDRERAPAMYSKEYISRIDSVLNSKNFNVVGASFRNDYGTEYSSYVTIYTNGIYLSRLKNGACTISLSDLDIPTFKDPLYQKRSENGYKLGLLYRKVAEKKKNGTYVSYAQTQLELLQDLRCEYAIFSKGYVIPENIQTQIKTIFEDKNSGEKFAVLKSSKTETAD